MVSGNSPAKATGEALVIVREFDAPVALVWQAWSDAEMLRQWWGPAGFSSRGGTVDFRVGGKWHVAMSSPEFMDDQDLWSTGTYREIVPMERIVTTDSFADAEGNVVPSSHYGMDGLPLEFLVTVTFEDLGGRTRMTLRHEGFPEGEHKMGANEGWNSSFDKLAAMLAA